MDEHSIWKHGFGTASVFLYSCGIFFMFIEPGIYSIVMIACGVLGLVGVGVLARVERQAPSRCPNRIGTVLDERMLVPHEDCGTCLHSLYEQLLDCTFHGVFCRVVICKHCGTVYEHEVNVRLDIFHRIVNNP